MGKLAKHENTALDVEKARDILATCKRVDVAQDIRDKAQAVQMYLRSRGASVDAINDAAEVKLRAERKLGQLIKRMPKAKGKRTDLVTTRHQVDDTPTYEDQGIDKKQASRWQRIGATPNNIFEKYIKETRERADKITTTGLVKEAIRDHTKKKRVERVEKLEEMDWPKDQYRVIYADPPWQYSNSGNKESYGHAERHYPTMSTEDICELDVESIATGDSVLFMWATSPMLEDAMQVINAWGFKYKTSFVWDKESHNWGYYNSVQHELLLLATKGSCLPDIDDRLPSIVRIKKSRKHSEKPKEFRAIVDKLYPNGPRIELFARTKTKGWEVYGNEVTK